MTEDEAYAYFLSIRFKDNGGKAQCPHCGCGACYEYRARRIFKCISCEKQFSATTKTEFSGRKLSFRQILELIVEFALPAKGASAIQVSKNLGINYRTAFYRLHALRRGMRRSQEGTVFDSPVEIDGAEFGGYIKPKNLKEHRTDRRRVPYRSKGKQVVGVIRERRRGGRTRVEVAKTERQAAKFMPKYIKPGTKIFADGGTAFNFMDKNYPMRRINHKDAYWRKPNIHTNNAECFFSMLRRAERGIYHHIGGPYLAGYASEVAWRQDRRRMDTKSVFEELCGHMTALIEQTTLANPVEVDEIAPTSQPRRQRARPRTKGKGGAANWDDWKANFAEASAAAVAKQREQHEKRYRKHRENSDA